MVDFVTRLEPAQYGDGIDFGRLADVHLLKAALKGLGDAII
jgi:hypothetical protein